MKVEHFFKATVSSMWDFIHELTYVKTAMGILHW